MKPVWDATNPNNAAGDGWFKIYEMAYDSSSDEWCTQKLIANDGFLSVNLPQGIKGGDYLVRTELLALHAAQDNPPDPQFYVGCAQVFVEGPVNGNVPDGVFIDSNTYDLDTPGLTYNIYEDELEPFPSIGPKVYQPNTFSISSSSSGQRAVQKNGLMPEGCILVRDDWCGFEVSHYETEQGCWDVRFQPYPIYPSPYSTYLAMLII